MLKYVHKYRFLSIDKKDVYDRYLKLVTKFKYDFDELILKNNDIPNKNNDIPNKNNDIQNKSEFLELEKLENDNENMYKNIYKEISIITHPDKSFNDGQLFCLAYDSYKKNNILELLSIADKIDIDIEKYKDFIDINIIKNQVNELEEKIVEYKNSFIWKYYNGNEQEIQEIKKKIEEIRINNKKMNIII